MPLCDLGCRCDLTTVQTVIDYKAVATVGGDKPKKKDRRVDVPTLQLAVLRCDCAVGLVCDLCEVFDLGVFEQHRIRPHVSVNPPDNVIVLAENDKLVFGVSRRFDLANPEVPAIDFSDQQIAHDCRINTKGSLKDGNFVSKLFDFVVLNLVRHCD